MAIQIIEAYPKIKRVVTGNNFLLISEFFYDTIQGEGIYAGHPAAFLRLQKCTLDCIFCDTTEVWRTGNPYTFDEIWDLMCKTKTETNPGIIERLRNGQHLVLTGGSPLRQQENLGHFITFLCKKLGFKPFIEVENECVLQPNFDMMNYVDCWNNSPKLASSGNPVEIYYNKEVIKFFSRYIVFKQNAWFKFVVSGENDWMEIKERYIDESLIVKQRIILMPEGATRQELEKNRQFVVNLAIKNNVRYCTREHIILWDKKTGV